MHKNTKATLNPGSKNGLSSGSFYRNKEIAEDKSKNNPINKTTGNKNTIPNKTIQNKEEKKIHD